MAEEQLSPISAAKPPAVNPLGAPSHASTLKLKPVIRKPVAGGAARPGLKLPTRPAVAGAHSAAAPAATPAPATSAGAGDSMSQLQTVTQKLKGITQKLKGVTQQIPQQAILRKTGIIADQNLTEAQKQASKSRTARISLSDALGVAPVKDEAAPMKTIRIKRPDLPGAAKPAVKPPAAAEEPAAQAPVAEGAPQGAEQSITQRKTLKISRPGGGVRPGGAKFAIKKPGAPAAPAAKDGAADGGDVPEMDVPEMPATAPAFTPYGPRDKGDDGIAGVPTGLLVFDFILQFAACIAVGFLGWLLYTDLNTTWF